MAYTAGTYSETTRLSMVLIPTTAMFILYTVAPMLYRLASSAYFNLSLLSSDFYGLLFGKCPMSIYQLIVPDQK